MSDQHKPVAMHWRQYPKASKQLGPGEARLHIGDRFSEKPPSADAAKVIADALARRPLRPPGAR